jgi:hypothetical protein
LDLGDRDPAAFIPRYLGLDRDSVLAAELCADRRVDRAGVDTWSFGWYLDPDSACFRNAKLLASEPTKRGYLIPDPVAGHRVGLFSQAALLFAEGHPAEDGELGPAESLPAAVDRVLEGLLDLGVVPPVRAQVRRGIRHQEDGRELETWGPGFAGVRRIDTTVDLRYDSAAEGLAVLQGMAAMSLPRSKKKIVQEVGGRRIETVYYLGYGGRSVLARCYDKGVESSSAARGSWVRPENQQRYSKEARPPVEMLAAGSYLRDSFVRRFEPLWRASRGVIVGGERQLAGRLRDLVSEGAIKPSTAKALAGHIALDAAGVHEDIQARSTVLGDRAACRDLGLVLNNDVVDDIEVRLDEQLERAFDSEVWGQG